MNLSTRFIRLSLNIPFNCHTDTIFLSVLFTCRVRVNFEHLKLFVRVAATQNISLAGKEFGLSPAASGAQLNKLEQHLGVRLVNRTTRKVSLTEDGELFLPHAEELLSNVEIAKASVGNSSVKPKGTLRVTAPASFARLHLTPIIKPFLSKYPDLKLDLK